MKINDKRKVKVEFGDIKPGAVFSYCDGDYYMKTETTYGDDNGNYDNTVNLETGELLFFKDSTVINLIKCELTIEM